MAGRPPRRLPPAIQQLVSAFERDTDVGSEQAALEARDVGLKLESEVSLKTPVNTSDLYMSAEELEDDDLLDDEEEYRKEMEDQRIVDAKNGHFEDDQPPARATVTAEEAAEYLALSLAAFPIHHDGDMVMTDRENPATGGGASSRGGESDVVSDVDEQPPCMGLVHPYVNPDTFVVEGKDQIRESPGTGGGLSLSGGCASSTGGGSGVVSEGSDQSTTMSRVQLSVNLGMGVANPSLHGVAVSDSVMTDQPSLENCKEDECSKHACMGSRYTFNAKCTNNQHNMPYFMEKKQLQTLKYGRVEAGVDLVSLASDGIRSQDLLPAESIEETLQLDLMEVRSLVSQEVKSGQKFGPPNFKLHTPLAQVTPSLAHSFNSSSSSIPQPSISPNSPQPIPLPSNFKPKNLLNNISPQPTNKSNPKTIQIPAQKQIKPRIAANAKKLPPFSLDQIVQPLPPVRSLPPRSFPATNFPAILKM